MVEPTHIEKYANRQIGFFQSPIFRGENQKYLSYHHLVISMDSHHFALRNALKKRKSHLPLKGGPVLQASTPEATRMTLQTQLQAAVVLYLVLSAILVLRSWLNNDQLKRSNTNIMVVGS